MSLFEHDNVEIVFASFYYWKDKSLEIYKPDLPEGVYTSEYISEHLFKEIQFPSLSCIGSKIYKKSLIDDNNIRFDTDYKSFGEDMAFMISCLMKAGRAGYTDFPFYRYRMREVGSVSHTYRPEYFSDSVRVGKIILSFMNNTSEGRKIYYSSLSQAVVSSLVNELQYKGMKSYVQEFRKIRSNPVFKEIMSSTELLSRKKKILVFLVKHNFVYTVLLLLFLRGSR